MISVCMATYNGEKYIKEQIDSILVQLEPDDELIISDDGSTNQTIDIIKNINDSRIKLFYFNSHCYTCNFENALNHAKGDYIFLADQDDVWVPGKVEKCLNALQNNDFVVTDAYVVDSNKNVILPSYFNYLKVKKGYLYNLIRTRYIGACMAFRKETLKKILPFPKNHTYVAHDYWIACICEKYYKVNLLKESLMLYRRHDSNVTHGALNKSKMSIKNRIIKRIYTVYHIFLKKTD